MEDEKKEEKVNTDGADWETVLEQVIKGAGRHRPNVRLLGDVRAVDIQVALGTALVLARSFAKGNK